MINRQETTPLCAALEEMKNNRIIPFDVPGHKRGAGNKPLRSFLGQQCLAVDVNSMKALDNQCHPTGVIRKAEELAAEAFRAAHAFFMVGGTTSAVQAMLFAACKRGDKIILPRNVHRSALNALVLCGAVPVYIECRTHPDLGIPLGSTLQDVENAILQNPEAKAVFVNNPTYYGICSDIAGIVALAHRHGMLLLADEAHGTHFYFGDGMPLSAMAAGADMAAVSMHKSGGSLTQSSLLLCGKAVNAAYVRQIINLTQTTSASYLLLSSLDMSRRLLAVNGREIFLRVLELTCYAREEINKIEGLYAFGEELVSPDVFAFDRTKLSVNTAGIGLAGIEVYEILRDEYDIQIEFGDMGNILAYVSIGDTPKNMEMLIGALAEIKRRHAKPAFETIRQEYIAPEVCTSPQQAFYAVKKTLPLKASAGKTCAEFVMCYPPGIPIIAPGERITPEIVAYILYAKEKGCLLTGPEDMRIEMLNVLAGEE